MSHSASFLHSTESGPARARHNFWRVIRGAFFALLIMIVLYSIVLVVALTQMVAHVFDGRDALLLAREQALVYNMTGAERFALKAQTSFVAAEHRVILLKPLAFVPVVNDAISATKTLATSAVDITDSFIELIDFGTDLLQLSGLSEEYLLRMQDGLEPTVTFDDLSTATKEAMLERFQASADELTLLVKEFEIIEKELLLIEDHLLLQPMAAAASGMYTDIAQTKNTLERLAIAATIIPAVAGVDGEQVHLLLFLNNNELRPGGGFIGSYGVLRLDRGSVNQLETADVYTLDNAAEDAVIKTAPAPLQRYNETTNWYFRDSNWSPDFATSSMWGIERFLTEVDQLSDEQKALIPSSTRVDGVIGFTPTYAAELLKVVGDTSVGGQTFTPENVAELLEFQVQFGFAEEGLPNEQRKEILADLVNEVKARLFALPLSKWSEVLDASSEALRTKQLVFYSSDQELESMYSSLGWGGRVETTASDMQMVVDANLASLKTDPAVDRSITYQLGRNQSGDWVGRTTIAYDHNGSFDWKTTRYRTYTRLYLPFGTEFIRAEGMLIDDLTKNVSAAAGPVDIGEELGFTVFGAFIAIEPGEERELIFEYKLADTVIESIRENTYALSVLKQIGARDRALTVELDFDKTITHADPAEDAGEWGDDTYLLNTILDQDLEIGVRF